MGAFQTYFIDVIKNKYCQFSGRARRKEYWMFWLFYTIISLILNILASLAAALGGADSFIAWIPMIFLFIFALGIILPSMSLGWRRLHDIGKSGWWVLIALVPFVGGIVLFVFACLDSQPGSNQYGPNPKGMESQAASDVFV